MVFYLLHQILHTIKLAPEDLGNLRHYKTLVHKINLSTLKRKFQILKRYGTNPQISCDACSLPTYSINRTPNQPKLCKQQATLNRVLPVWDNYGNVGGSGVQLCCKK